MCFASMVANMGRQRVTANIARPETTSRYTGADRIDNRHMDEAKNKDLVRRFYAEVVSAGAVGKLAEFIAPDYSEIHEDKKSAVGIEGVKAHILGVRHTYPDLELTVEQQIAEGDWVATRLMMRGTHQGEWQGIKPTGRPLRVTAVNPDRIRDRRIVEHGGAADFLGPLLEIGAIQPVGR